MRKHIITVGYVLFSGLIATLLTYYLLFRLLAAAEGTTLAQVGSIFTILSPLIGPIIGASLFFWFLDKRKISIPRGLWKYAFIYSLAVAIVHELYLLGFNSQWSGLGILIGVISGITLSGFAYAKEKKSRAQQGNE